VAPPALTSGRRLFLASPADAGTLVLRLATQVLEPLVVDGRSMEPAPEHEHEAWAAIAESLTCNQAGHPLSHTSSLGDHNRCARTRVPQP
jgi:hypothetical protein